MSNTSLTSPSICHNFMITIDEEEYNNSVQKCKELLNEVKNHLRDNEYSDRIQITPGTYFFKMLNSNKDGLQLCVSPKTGNIEIYNIHNNKKNIVNVNVQNTFTDVNHIMQYFSINFLNKFDIATHMNNIFINVHYLFTTLYSNFKVTKMKHIIKIMDINNKNGYYIYFDMKNFASIGTINGNRYYNQNAKHVQDYSDLIKLFNLLINKNQHNLKYYNVIDSKYLDCNMNEYCNTTIDEDDVSDPE